MNQVELASLHEVEKEEDVDSSLTLHYEETEHEDESDEESTEPNDWRLLRCREFCNVSLRVNDVEDSLLDIAKEDLIYDEPF